jgi:hypothetical protein
VCTCVHVRHTGYSHLMCMLIYSIQVDEQSAFVLAEDSLGKDSITEKVSKVVGIVGECNVTDTERVTSASDDDIRTGEESSDESTNLNIQTSTKTPGGKLVLCRV